MIIWYLSADVWSWQLSIHPHTDGLHSWQASVKIFARSNVTFDITCTYEQAHVRHNQIFSDGYIVYQIFLPKVLRAQESSAIKRQNNLSFIIFYSTRHSMIELQHLDITLFSKIFQSSVESFGLACLLHCLSCHKLHIAQRQSTIRLTNIIKGFSFGIS